MTKYTNKKTHLVFNSNEDRKKAEDFLFYLKCSFKGILKKPVLIINAAKYMFYDLDLYLPEHKAATFFTISKTKEANNNR